MGKVPQHLRETIARNIRECRLEKFPGRGGAKRCAESFGVSPQQWSPWERGMRTPDELRMSQIAEFFRTTVDWLRTDHRVGDAAPASEPVTEEYLSDGDAADAASAATPAQQPASPPVPPPQPASPPVPAQQPASPPVPHQPVAPSFTLTAGTLIAILGHAAVVENALASITRIQELCHQAMGNGVAPPTGHPGDAWAAEHRPPVPGQPPRNQPVKA